MLLDNGKLKITGSGSAISQALSKRPKVADQLEYGIRPKTPMQERLDRFNDIANVVTEEAVTNSNNKENVK